MKKCAVKFKGTRGQNLQIRKTLHGKLPSITTRPQDTNRGVTNLNLTETFSNFSSRWYPFAAGSKTSGFSARIRSRDIPNRERNKKH